MARSNAPAGSMLAMRPRDLLAFARMHLEDGRAADGTQVLAPGTPARMQAHEVDLPDIGLMGTSWGLGFERFDTRGGDGHRPRRQHHRPGRLPADGPRGRARGHPADQRRRRVLALPRRGRPRPRGARRRRPARACRRRPRTPRRSTPSRFRRHLLGRGLRPHREPGRRRAGSGSRPSPRACSRSSGGQAERKELVAYRDDMLIPLQPDRGMHMPHAFLGDDGRAAPSTSSSAASCAAPAPDQNATSTMKLQSATRASASTLAIALAGCGGGGGGGGRRSGGGRGRRVRRRRHLHLRAVLRPGQPRPADGRRAPRCSPSPSSPTTRWSASTARRGEIQSAAGRELGGRRHHRRRSRSTRASPAPTAPSSPPTDVADSLNFVTDEENQSPFLGTFIPVGATAAADDAAAHRDAHAGPSRRRSSSTGSAACRSCAPRAPADRASLATATAGTGPYELTEAAPGDHYTYTKRDGYTWGPDGATTDDKGLPDTVVVQGRRERDDRGQPAALRRA